jgi:hypothetical protein
MATTITSGTRIIISQAGIQGPPGPPGPQGPPGDGDGAFDPDTPVSHITLESSDGTPIKIHVVKDGDLHVLQVVQP